MNSIAKEDRKWLIDINADKTKAMMVTRKDHKEIDIKYKGKYIEQVKKFCYLGITIEENLKNDVDVKCNIGKAKESFWRCKELFKNNISPRLKLMMLHSKVFSVVRYGSECFALTKTLKKKLTSFEIWCYRRILKISWTDMQTNEAVLQKMKLAKPVLLNSIIKRKAAFFGHVARGSAGEELRGIVEDSWRKIGRGRRRTVWLDDVEMVTKDVRKNLEHAVGEKTWRRECKKHFI